MSNNQGQDDGFVRELTFAKRRYEHFLRDKSVACSARPSKFFFLSLTHSLTHSLALSLSLSHTHSLSHTLSHSHSLTLYHSLTLSLSPTLTVSHSLTLTHSFTLSLSLELLAKQGQIEPRNLCVVTKAFSIRNDIIKMA